MIIDEIEIGNQKLINIYDDICYELVNNRGVFLHINYDGNFEVSDFKVLPFATCRLGIADSKDYHGKVLISKKWSDEKFNYKKDCITLNVFNDNKKVIEEQVNKAGSIENYQGQVYFYNMDNNYIYPLSRINSVLADCNNEFNASVYKNNILENGFIQSTFFITRPLETNSIIEDVSQSGLARRQRIKDGKKQFDEQTQKMLGAKGIGGFMHMQIDFAGEKLSDAFEIKTIKSDINPDLFKFVEESATSKILMAYNNIPISLVKSPDSALMGTSGEGIRASKDTYWENTTKDRQLATRLLNSFLNKITVNKDIVLNVLPLITKEITEDSARVENQKAQAQLRGSVGGVQSLIQVKQSVKDGVTSYDSAVAMTVEIFGFSEEKAKQILGNEFNTTNPNVTN